MNIAEEFSGVGIPKEVMPSLSKEALAELATKLDRFVKHATHPDRAGEVLGHATRFFEDRIDFRDNVLLGTLDVTIDQFQKELRDLERFGLYAVLERQNLGASVLQYLRTFSNDLTIIEEGRSEYQNHVAARLLIMDPRFDWQAERFVIGGIKEFDRARLEIRNRLRSEGKEGNLEEINSEMEERVSSTLKKCYEISALGEVTQVQDGKRTGLPDKHFIGSVLANNLLFLDRVVLGDFERQHPSGAEAKRKSQCIASPREFKRDPIGTTVSQQAEQRLVGANYIGEFDFDPLSLSLDKFWRIVRALEAPLQRDVRGGLRYLLSFNAPKGEPAYVEIEGEVLSIEFLPSGKPSGAAGSLSE